MICLIIFAYLLVGRYLCGMQTRDKIIQIGDELIRKIGYNAFSFSDISKILQIKNASIHYHFPTKSMLVISIIQKHLYLLERFKKTVSDRTATDKMIQFLAVYAMGRSNSKISILGALANDYYTFDTPIQNELKLLMENTLNWLTETLKEGRTDGSFHYPMDHRTKATMIITNLLGAEKLARITFSHDFQEIKETILSELIK